MKYGLILLFSFAALAQEVPKALDVAPSAMLSVDIQVPAPTLKLETIRLDGEQLQASDMQRLRTRSGGTGGDDVGNGGDELRQEFLFLGDQMLQEMGNKELRNKLEGALTIRRVVAVNNLSVRRGSEEIFVKSIAVEGIILLDAAAWGPIDGLLSPGHDPRFEILKLMAQAQGLDAKTELLLHSWHGLSARLGQIWCPVRIEKTKLTAEAKDFEASARSPSEAERAALARCTGESYADCRIAETSVRGFGAWAKPYAKARGQRYKAVLKTSAELMQERCEAVRQCEIVHEWAPAGQVRPAAFLELEAEANKSCR